MLLLWFHCIIVVDSFLLSQRISRLPPPPFIAESADICWLYLLWLPNWKVLTKVQSWHAHPVSCGKWHWGWKELAMTRLEPVTYKTNVWCSSNWATTCLYESNELYIVMFCLGATSVLCAGYATDQACWLQFPVALTLYIVLTHPPCCDSWTLMNCGIIVSPKDHCVLCMWGIIVSLRIIVSYVWGIIVSLRIIVSYVWGIICR